MKKIIILLFLIVILSINPLNIKAKNNKNLVNIYFFHSNTCSHCKEEKEFLNTLEKKYKNIKIYKYEINEKNNQVILEEVENTYELKINSVPLTIIGNKAYTGFSEKSKIKFIKTIEYFSRYGYEDKIGKKLNLELPTYNTNKQDIDIETFINTYHNYKLFGIKTNDLDISSISLLTGMKLPFNLINIIGILLILIILSKIKNSNLLIIMLYPFINTLLITLTLINKYLSIVISISIILICIYIYITKREYKNYSIIILLSIIISLFIINIDNQEIIIFKNIINLYDPIGFEKLSYYSNYLLINMSINIIILYIFYILTSKNKNHTK